MIAAGSTLAGRYRVERLIAHGGMASVFAAYDEVLDRAVAVKALRHGESVDRTRFDREARMLAGLTHPNLVSVYDAGEQDGEVFMVLELIEGPTLAGRLAGGPLAGDEARLVGAELAAALAHVHAQGIVHRDVKPSNVLLDGAARARLGDFGIAHLADSTALTASATTIGTAAYMAPEQLEGQTATNAADVYALGLVLLECLTGRRAFPGPAPASSLARLSRDPDIPADLPAPWPALLAAMTARDPSARPDAAAVAAALDAEQTDDAVTATDPVAATTPMPMAEPEPTLTAAGGPRGDRRPLLWVGAALLALLALLIGAVALAARDDPAPTTISDPSATPSTLPTSAPPATAPPTTAVTTEAPAVDCAALEAEKDALEERKREIDEQYRDDRETRDRLRAEIQDRKHEIDEQLRENCR